jgi:ATP-dependent Lhr-like helicase
MHDCLHEALDLPGLLHLLGEIERGQITLVARDTREPSPFSYELLNSNPYAFLDGGEIQERRARAVSTRRSLTADDVNDLCRLDPEAIAQVCEEARPLVRDADELHDVLLGRIVLPDSETVPWKQWSTALAAESRAATIRLPDGQTAWVSAERLPAALAVFPNSEPDPPLTAPAGVRHDWSEVDGRVAIVRGLIETCGPTTASIVAVRTAITQSQAFAALEALEGEGVVLRGRFNPTSTTASAGGELEVEWCHRRLLARIHRLTMQGLRRQIEPVGVDVFIRYLTRRHGLLPAEKRGDVSGLFEIVQLLQGIDAPAVCWERDILPARLRSYKSAWLDELCLTGEIGWGRLFPPKANPDRDKSGTNLTRVVPISLWLRSDVQWLSLCAPTADLALLSNDARRVYDLLDRQGAMFFHDMLRESGVPPRELSAALAELVSRGTATADGFAGLRGLLPQRDGEGSLRVRPRHRGVFRKRGAAAGTGRWSLWRRSDQNADRRAEYVEQWAWLLLRRWGSVFRDLLVRENGAPPWFELLQVYRRLEARGEIRGGRFVAGVAGEQFALGDTVAQLRNLRELGPQQELVLVSAADPLNLIGILSDHARVPSTASNRVAYLDGVPVGCLKAKEVQLLEELSETTAAEVTSRLQRRGEAHSRQRSGNQPEDLTPPAVETPPLAHAAVRDLFS